MSTSAEILFRVAMEGAADVQADTKSVEGALDSVEAKLESLAKTSADTSDSVAKASSVWTSGFKDLGESAEKKFDAATGGAVRFETVMGGVKLAAGAAAAGIAGVSAALVYGFTQAAEAEDATRHLTAALQSQGAATEGNVAALSAFSEGLAEASRWGGEAITETQALGLALGVPVVKIREFTQAAADLAAGRGIGLEDAARALGQTFDGTAGKAATLIPQLAGLTEAQLRNGDAVKLVASLYGGSASADAATLNGALAQLRETMGDAAQALALGFTGTNDMGAAVNTMRSALVDAMPQIREAGRLLSVFASAGLEALGALDAMNQQGILKTLFNTSGVSGREALGEGASAFDPSSKMGQMEGLQKNVAALSAAIRDEQAKLAQMTSTAEASARIMGAEVFGAVVSEQVGKIGALGSALDQVEAALVAYRASLKGTTAEERNLGTESTVTAGTIDTLGGAAKGAESDFSKLAKRVRDYADVAAGVKEGEGASLVLSLKDQAAVMQGAISNGEGMRNAIIAAMQDPKADALALLELLHQVDESLKTIEESSATDRARAKTRADFEAAAAGAPMGPNAPWLEAGFMGPPTAANANIQAGVDEAAKAAVRDAEAAATRRANDELIEYLALTGDLALAKELAAQAELERVAAGTGPDAEAAAEKLRVMQAEEEALTRHYDQVVALIEQGYTRAEAEAQVADELERQAAAQGKATAAGEQAIKAAERQNAMAKIGRESQAMFANALGNTAGRFIDMAISGEISGKKLLKAMLEDLSNMAKMKAIEATALGFMRLANYDAGSASQAFTSAAIWGTLAVGAGVAAGAVGGKEDKPPNSNGESAGESSSFGRNDELSSIRERTSEGQRMPSLSVVFTGSQVIAGTTPENFASMVAPFIQEYVRESGGRDGSARP